MTDFKFGQPVRLASAFERLPKGTLGTVSTVRPPIGVFDGNCDIILRDREGYATVPFTYLEPVVDGEDLNISPYLTNPPLTTREREVLERVRYVVAVTTTGALSDDPAWNDGYNQACRTIEALLEPVRRLLGDT